MQDQRHRTKFDAHNFEPEVFRKQMFSIEESTCDIGGTIVTQCHNM